MLKLLMMLMLLPATGWASTCTGYPISSCVRAENVLDGDLGALVLTHGQAAPYTFSGGSVTILGAAYGLGSQGPSSVGSIAAMADTTFLVKSTSSVNAHKVLAVQNNAGSELLSLSRAGTLVLSSVLGSAYGGTGGDMSAATIGAVPYLSATGVMSALAAGTANYLLQANGAGAPSFTNTPTVLGTNITAIPAANVLAGSLGAGAFAVTGAFSATGNLVVAPGTLYTSTFTASNGNADIKGAVTVGGTLGATGASNLAAVNASGNVIVGGGTLYASTFTAASGNLDLAGTLDVEGLITDGTLAAAKAVTLSDNYIPVQINAESQTNPGSAYTLGGIYAKVGNKSGVDQANTQLVGVLARVAMNDNLTDAYGVQSHLTIAAGASSPGNMTAVSGKTVLGDSVSAGIVSAGLFTVEGTHGSAFAPSTGYGVWADIVDANLTAGMVVNANDSTLTSGLLLTKSGTGGMTSDITLQNGEAISNAVDGTVSIQGIVSAASGPIKPYSRSKAQLVAITPGIAGEAYFCNDCSPLKLVVSTGTSAGNFADPAGGEFK